MTRHEEIAQSFQQKLTTDDLKHISNRISSRDRQPALSLCF